MGVFRGGAAQTARDPLVLARRCSGSIGVVSVSERLSSRRLGEDGEGRSMGVTSTGEGVSMGLDASEGLFRKNSATTIPTRRIVNESRSGMLRFMEIAFQVQSGCDRPTWTCAIMHHI